VFEKGGNVRAIPIVDPPSGTTCYGTVGEQIVNRCRQHPRSLFVVELVLSDQHVAVGVGSDGEAALADMLTVTSPRTPAVVNVQCGPRRFLASRGIYVDGALARGSGNL
jgi:hypothetical protein